MSTSDTWELDEELSADREFDLIVSEAVDRLRKDIAEDVADVVGQLSDEGLTYTFEQGSALERVLRARGYR